MSSILNRILGERRQLIAGAAQGADPTPAPTAPAPAPTPEPPANSSALTHAEWMSKCKALLPEGAEMHEACCYSLGGKMYLQMCVTDQQGNVTLKDAPVEVPMTTEQPAPMPEEEPMEPGAKAPDFLIRAFGLAEGATIQDCMNAHAAQQKATADADIDAKTAWLTASGCAGDLADVLAAQLQPAAGQSRKEAAQAMKASRPSAFGSSEPAQQKPAASRDVPHAPPLAAGADLKRNDDQPGGGASLTPAAQRKASVDAFRNGVDSTYKQGRN